MEQIRLALALPELLCLVLKTRSGTTYSRFEASVTFRRRPGATWRTDAEIRRQLSRAAARKVAPLGARYPVKTLPASSNRQHSSNNQEPTSCVSPPLPLPPPSTPPRDLMVGEPGSPVASSADPRFAQFKVIRRNGAVVALRAGQDHDRDDQGVSRRQRRPGRELGARPRRGRRGSPTPSSPR